MAQQHNVCVSLQSTSASSDQRSSETKGTENTMELTNMISRPKLAYFFCYSDILGFHESNFSNFIFKHPQFSSLLMESFPCADSRWKKNQKLEKSAVQWQKVRGGRKWAAGAGERKRFFFFSFKASKWERASPAKQPSWTHKQIYEPHALPCHAWRQTCKKKPSVVRDTNPFLSGHQWCILLFLDWHQWKNTAYRKHCPFTNILMPPFPPDGL